MRDVGPDAQPIWRQQAWALIAYPALQVRDKWPLPPVIGFAR